LASSRSAYQSLASTLSRVNIARSSGESRPRPLSLRPLAMISSRALSGGQASEIVPSAK
jgi:hypothetical protein